MKFIKTKKFVSVVIAFALGISTMANAASWNASHVNQPGVPTNTGNKPIVTVYHGALGAVAVCNYNDHSNTGAYNGQTRITCITYSMSQVTIYGLNSKNLNPNVGSPNVPVMVKYRVTAYTPHYPDTFVSKGNITPK